MEYAFDVFVDDADDPPSCTVENMPTTHLVAIWPAVKELLPHPADGPRDWELTLRDGRVVVRLTIGKIVESPGEFRNE
jgi:hypothetical protein